MFSLHGYNHVTKAADWIPALGSALYATNTSVCCCLASCFLEVGSWLAFELQYWDLFPITKRFVSPFLILPSYKEAAFKLPPLFNFHVIYSCSAVKIPMIPNTGEILSVNGILFKNCVMLLNQWRFMWYGKHCSTSLSWKKKHTKKRQSNNTKAHNPL